MGWYYDALKLMNNNERELCALIEKVSMVPFSRIFNVSFEAKRQESIMLSFLNKDQEGELLKYIKRRMSGEPLQYITGYTDFYGLDFITEKNVLIPRFDTECLVDEALITLKDGDSVLDLCCGSGCVGITLAIKKNIKLTASDISQSALELTQRNSEKYNICANIIKHDVFCDKLDDKYNLIVCNPPYIPTKDLNNLSVEVKQEPEAALDGGSDGLRFYRYIARKYKSNILAGGKLIFECGINQSCDIENVMKNTGYIHVYSRKDYNMIERVVSASI